MIRLMKKEDVQGVAKLEKECFSMPWSAESLEKEIMNKDSFFCVCEKNNEIAGYGGIYLAYPEGEITNIAVAEKYRKQGIASEILKYIFNETEKLGITSYTLEARVSNIPAIALYEKYGFVSEGIRKGFYDKPKEDACIMWKRN